MPLEALSQPLLFNAIVAFAAIHLGKTTIASLRAVAEKHHEKCVKLLIGLKEDDVEAEDGITLAAVCLLRSYEILGEEFDPNRHLSGAFALAMNRSHDLHQPSLARAGFFNFMREDVTYSLINRCPLKVDVENMDIFGASDDEDRLNVATLYLAKAINVTFGGTTTNAATTMLESFETWCGSLPIQFKPYFETPYQQQNTLPTIRMLRACHVSVFQYCLVTKCVLGSAQATINSESERQLHEHAVRICGLAFTSESAAVVVNSFGPISFSCRFLQCHPLRLELVRRLHGCRKETGWPVQRIIDDLEQYWAQADG